MGPQTNFRTFPIIHEGPRKHHTTIDCIEDSLSVLNLENLFIGDNIK